MNSFTNVNKGYLGRMVKINQHLVNVVCERSLRLVTVHYKMIKKITYLFFSPILDYFFPS